MTGECTARLAAACVRARLAGRRLAPREFGVLYDLEEERYRYDPATRSCCPIGALLVVDESPPAGSSGAPFEDAAALLRVRPEEVESFCHGFDGRPCGPELIHVAFDAGQPARGRVVATTGGRIRIAWKVGCTFAECFLSRLATGRADAASGG
jgi:hypothetical protein